MIVFVILSDRKRKQFKSFVFITVNIFTAYYCGAHINFYGCLKVEIDLITNSSSI